MPNQIAFIRSRLQPFNARRTATEGASKYQSDGSPRINNMLNIIIIEKLVVGRYCNLT